MKRFYFGFIVATLLFVGCSRDGGDNRIPGASDVMATDASGNPITLDVAGLPIHQLAGHPNPIIGNNVEKAVESLEKNDLAQGMLALTAVSSIPGELDANQMTAVQTTMDEVAKVASAAAEEGNENAQYAMEILNTFISGQ